MIKKNHDKYYNSSRGVSLYNYVMDFYDKLHGGSYVILKIL